MPEDKSNDDKVAAGADATIAEQTTPDGLSTTTGHGETSVLISPIPGLAIAALVALLVWGVLEVMPPVFEMPEHLRELSGNAPEAQQKERLAASLATSNNNATLAIGMLAATLGLCLTIAEVTLRGQGLRVIWGGLLAIVIAGACAVGGGILGGRLYASAALPEDPLTRTIIVQASMWGLAGLGVGAALGLAVTIPKVRPRLLGNCVVGGMLGGLLAGLVFPLASSVLMPNARTEVLMADPGVSRLLWLALASCGIVLVLSGMVKQQKTA